MPGAWPGPENEDAASLFLEGGDTLLNGFDIYAGRTGLGQFVPGVSYQFDSDGQPIRTPETAAAEERAFKAQRELEEENWRASGLRYADPETGEIVEPEEQP